MAIETVSRASARERFVDPSFAKMVQEVKVAFNFFGADLDKNGSLSRSEWQQAGFGKTVGNFNNANTNGKGGINMTEFRAANKA